jgi:hypothetical protein
MWIFLNNAFLSIVDKGGDGTTLLVRARKDGDIQCVFPDSQVKETPGNDYRFRARINRDLVAKAISDSVQGITYPNFKGSVKERRRHDAYMDVWSVMHRFQGQN